MSSIKKLKLLIDMDSVAVDMYGYWLSLYNRDYKDNLTFEDIPGWAMHEYVKPECGRKIYSYLMRQGFFTHLKPVKDCPAVMRRLHDRGHDLVIVTAVPPMSRTASWEKFRWMRKHLPFIPEKSYINAHRKELVMGDVLFDDGPHNIKDFPNIAVAFDYPWNRHVEADYRVSSWLEFEELIYDLEKRSESSL